MAATIVTLNDLERNLSVTGLFKCNPSNICAAFYTISTDSVLARFLCISRASCSFLYLKYSCTVVTMHIYVVTGDCKPISQKTWISTERLSSKAEFGIRGRLFGGGSLLETHPLFDVVFFTCFLGLFWHHGSSIISCTSIILASIAFCYVTKLLSF